MAIDNIIVVGSGPAGLLLSLLLARAGINVQVLDQASALDTNPRATHYGPPAVHELRRAGVIDEVRTQGFTPRTVSWRKLDGTVLGQLDGSVLDGDPDRMTCLPLDRLGKILYENLIALPNAKVSWRHKVVGLGQDEQRAWVDVELEVELEGEGEGLGGGVKETKRIEADYVVGCDGANSQIRKSLFGDSNFPGKTWKEQIVATNVYYDLHAHGYDDANFFIHPEHWHMAARITRDGMWRVTYGEVPGLTREKLLARQPRKFETFLPGHPKPDQYKLMNISPYKVHQRIADKMRVGRFLLAADAAHLCNPFGGLGLTGGIADVGSLYECLGGIHTERADDSILDQYSDIRRKIWSDIIDPVSSDNIRRLFDQDPDKAAENDPFLGMCQRTEKDREFSIEFQSAINALKHDFTQYYRDAEAKPEKMQTAETLKNGLNVSVGIPAAVSD